jgi:hypothetical protein
VRSARPHPFAASAAALAELHPGKPTTVTVLLPSLLTAPLDSTELCRRSSSRPPSSTTRPHRCATRLGGAAAGLVGFAADLAARGRVLPKLDWESGALAARPVMIGPDAVRLHLVAVMPPWRSGRGRRPARRLPGPLLCAATQPGGPPPARFPVDALLDQLLPIAIRARE